MTNAPASPSAPPARSTSHSSSDQASNSSSGWERFLPPRPLRVLLVEEDIATRQIVYALLCKCGYEVKTSGDSATAWSLLQTSSTKFDLILADAFLPDFAGNDLLSKIMSHASHKDIPVVMMSSQDSLDVVFKCLLRGAKDFLVKPLRKNELRNLWQHVWRKNRESTRTKNGESARGQKRKATRMSSSGGDSSDGFSISGGSATQTSPMEAFELGKVINLAAVQPQKEKKASDGEAILGRDAFDFEAGSQRLLEQKDDYSSNSDDKEDSERSAKAIDLIGTMTENPIFDRSQLKAESDKSTLTNSLQSIPVLELTLRTCSKQHTQADHSGQTSLQQSYCSAFSKYISNITSAHQQASFRTTTSLPGDHNSHTGGINENTGASTLHFPQAVHFRHTGQFGAAALSLIASSSDENTRHPSVHEKSLSSFRCPSLNSTTMNSLTNRCNHPSSNKTSLDGSENGECGPGDAQSTDQPSAHHCRSVNTDNNQHTHLVRPSEVVDAASNAEQKASVHERSSYMMASSGGSNLCEEHRTVKSVNYCGSSNWGGNFGGCCEESSMNDCRPTATTSATTAAEDLEQLKNNEYRTAFRQAALNKFRQKRKVRCFEKKVRYQTRKKLAEQRPRVKGQFVRQTPVTLLQPDT